MNALPNNFRNLPDHIKTAMFYLYPARLTCACGCVFFSDFKEKNALFEYALHYYNDECSDKRIKTSILYACVGCVKLGSKFHDCLFTPPRLRYHLITSCPLSSESKLKSNRPTYQFRSFVNTTLIKNHMPLHPCGKGDSMQEFYFDNELILNQYFTENKLYLRNVGMVCKDCESVNYNRQLFSNYFIHKCPHQESEPPTLNGSVFFLSHLSEDEMSLQKLFSNGDVPANLVKMGLVNSETEEAPAAPVVVQNLGSNDCNFSVLPRNIMASDIISNHQPNEDEDEIIFLRHVISPPLRNNQQLAQNFSNIRQVTTSRNLPIIYNVQTRTLNSNVGVNHVNGNIQYAPRSPILPNQTLIRRNLNSSTTGNAENSTSNGEARHFSFQTGVKAPSNETRNENSVSQTETSSQNGRLGAIGVVPTAAETPAITQAEKPCTSQAIISQPTEANTATPTTSSGASGSTSVLKNPGQSNLQNKRIKLMSPNPVSDSRNNALPLTQKRSSPVSVKEKQANTKSSEDSHSKQVNSEQNKSTPNKSNAVEKNLENVLNAIPHELGTSDSNVTLHNSVPKEPNASISIRDKSSEAPDLKIEPVSVPSTQQKNPRIIKVLQIQSGVVRRNPPDVPKPKAKDSELAQSPSTSNIVEFESDLPTLPDEAHSTSHPRACKIPPPPLPPTKRTNETDAQPTKREKRGRPKKVKLPETFVEPPKAKPVRKFHDVIRKAVNARGKISLSEAENESPTSSRKSSTDLGSDRNLEQAGSSAELDNNPRCLSPISSSSLKENADNFPASRLSSEEKETLLNIVDRLNWDDNEELIVDKMNLQKNPTTPGLTIVGVYVCYDCALPFKFREEYLEHESEQHNLSLGELESLIVTRKLPFKCESCCETFNTASELSDHAEFHKVPEHGEFWKCNKCTFTVPKKSMAEENSEKVYYENIDIWQKNFTIVLTHEAAHVDQEYAEVLFS